MTDDLDLHDRMSAVFDGPEPELSVDAFEAARLGSRARRRRRTLAAVSVGLAVVAAGITAVQLPNLERAQLTPAAAASAPTRPAELFPTPQQIISDVERITGLRIDQVKTKADGPTDNGVNIWAIVKSEPTREIWVGVDYVPQEKVWSGLPPLCDPGKSVQDDNYVESSRCRRLPDGSALRNTISKPPSKQRGESRRPQEGNAGLAPTAVRRYSDLTHTNSWHMSVVESAPPGTHRLSGGQLEALLLALDAKYFKPDAPTRPLDPDIPRS